jgi:hypothetical protein
VEPVDDIPEATASGIDIAAAFWGMNAMDNMPFVPDNDDSVVSVSEFPNTGNWSDEEADQHEDSCYLRGKCAT